MNIVLLGPQGSGKGTQAKILVEKFGLFYFESGQFLRNIAENNDSLKNLLDSGQLVSDEEMCSYVKSYFDERHVYDNILFDGFPRDVEQHKFMGEWLNDRETKIDLVLVLEIGETETIKRLNLRKEKEGRADDNPESIKKRLSLYRERTEKLISEMKKNLKVVTVDGERSIEAIATDLEGIVRGIKDGNSD